tara:strand:- start:97 stop:324 length:228 start_codon:yes stop_codon:yes gene_type:complete
MSRDAAYQSQIEDEYDDLVMNIEFVFDILRNRMGNFETNADLDSVKEVNDYARSLVEDTEELINFLQERGFVSNT